MNEVATQNRNPLSQFKADMKRLKDAGEFDMLPANVSFENFRNAAVVAFTDNPMIRSCKPDSIFKSLRRLAAAGLVPDGREAAIVPYGEEAQALPMVAGLIKTARNSGEIISIWADVVYDGEELHVWVEDGERKFKHEYDPLRRSGEIVGAYAVAKLKDGTIEFEPMGLDQIHKRRRASANQKGDKPTGVWAQWFDEMCKKTAIRALCKRLPISSEDMRRIYVDADDTKPIRDVTPEPEAPPKERVNLAQRIQNPKPEGALDGEVMPPEDENQAGPDDTSLEYAMGQTAARDGASLNECPYEQGTQEWLDWAGGWNAAKESGDE
jgi:recombination protein RecT